MNMANKNTLAKNTLVLAVLAFVAFVVIKPLMKSVLPQRTDADDEDEDSAMAMSTGEGEEGEDQDDDDDEAAAVRAAAVDSALPLIPEFPVVAHFVRS